MTFRSYPAIMAFVCLILSACQRFQLPPADSKVAARSLTTTASSYTYDLYDLPVRLDSGFIWGVNGHPLVQSPYMGNLGTQMSLLKELQNTVYRMDFNCIDDSSGTISSSALNDVFTYTANNNITVLPVICFSHDVLSIPLAQAEEQGMSQGRNFVLNYGSHFPNHYYELGNEIDGWCQWNTSDGNVIANYDVDSTNIMCAYLKGMNEGVKAADPLAITIINSGDHYAWFQILDSHGVGYDIIGYHCYTDPTGFAQRLSTLQTDFPSRSVWFTEVNDDGTLTDTTAQATAIEQIIQSLDQQSNIKGFFFYELFNEGNQSGTQALYGLTSWAVPTNYTSALDRKPVFETYKFKIEEQKNGWKDYVYSLYLYCNLRIPDPSGLQYWINSASNERNNSQTVNAFLPGENFGIFIGQVYQQLLGRDADPSGLQYWTTELVNGTTRESVIEAFCSGNEFWSDAGSSTDGFITRMYTTLLNRSPSPLELTQWEDSLANGTSRSSMTGTILLGTEYLKAFVKAQFNLLLRRNNNIDTGSINHYVSVMQAGMDQLDLIKSLINSTEFWLRGIEEGYQRNNPPYTY